MFSKSSNDELNHQMINRLECYVCRTRAQVLDVYHVTRKRNCETPGLLLGKRKRPRERKRKREADNETH